MDIYSLSQKLISGELPLDTYINDTLTLINNTEPTIHALLPEPHRKDRLYLAAEQLLARYPDPASRPPLFGLLVGIKDLFNVEGLPTQAGSRLPPEAFTGPEAQVVTKLKELGAIILGKTVSTEFAYFSPGETRNPINPEHTPGGSSSGSAAAVAAGYCPFALGTQTIASIIRPASYCGVYGFKPSWGRISTFGVFPFSQTADHVGIIAHSFTSLSFLAQYLVSNWCVSRTLPELSLGAVRDDYLLQAGESVRANYAQCIKALRDKGYRIVEADPFVDVEAINTAHRKLIAAEFAINHRTLFRKFADMYSQPSKELYKSGIEISNRELKLLRKASIRLRDEISNFMHKYQINAWLTPSTTTIAPLGLASTGSPLMSLPWTNAGLPSITIPSGLDETGMPFGIQIITGYGSDEWLIEQSSTIDKLLRRVYS